MIMADVHMLGVPKVAELSTGKLIYVLEIFNVAEFSTGSS